MEELSITTALVVSSQPLGNRILVSLGQTALENTLLPGLGHDVQELDAQAIASLVAPIVDHLSQDSVRVQQRAGHNIRTHLY